MVEFFYVLIGQRFPLDKAAGLRTSRVGWLLAVRPSVAATGRISAGPQLAMCLLGMAGDRPQETPVAYTISFKNERAADWWLWTRRSSGRTKLKNGGSDHTLCTLRQRH